MHERGEPNAFLDSWERGHPCPHSARRRARALPNGRATAPRVRIAASILFREAFALSVIVAQFKRAIEETFQVHTFANGLTGRSRLSLFNEVAAAKFFRRQPNGPGNFVHVALQ